MSWWQSWHLTRQLIQELSSGAVSRLRLQYDEHPVESNYSTPLHLKYLCVASWKTYSSVHASRYRHGYATVLIKIFAQWLFLESAMTPAEYDYKPENTTSPPSLPPCFFLLSGNHDCWIAVCHYANLPTGRGTHKKTFQYQIISFVYVVPEASNNLRVYISNASYV
jgi:hypothetical protein